MSDVNQYYGQFRALFKEHVQNKDPNYARRFDAFMSSCHALVYCLNNKHMRVHPHGGVVSRTNVEKGLRQICLGEKPTVLLPSGLQTAFENAIVVGSPLTPALVELCISIADKIRENYHNASQTKA